MIGKTFSKRTESGIWASAVDAVFFVFVLTLSSMAFVHGNWKASQVEAAAHLAKNSELSVAVEGLRQKLTMTEEVLQQRDLKLAELIAERIRLETVKTDLTDDLTEKRNELNRLVAKLKELERLAVDGSEREKLKEQISRLTDEIGTLNENLARASELEKLAKNQVDAVNRELEKLKKELTEARKELDNLGKEVTEARKELAEATSREKVVHKELLGLRGEMRKVVVVFDTSGSMQISTRQNGEERWKHAQDVVRTWLQNLSVSECAIVLFSSSARPYPNDFSFVNIGDKSERERLLSQLENVEPSGGTNTLDALQNAYRFAGVDTILLFTDGAPNDGESSAFDPELAKAIRSLVKEKYTSNNVVVNTIGLGDYFKDDLAEFLAGVAGDTGGCFIGR